MKKIRSLISSVVFIGAVFAVVIPQTSADEFMNIDFDFNLSFDEELIKEDFFFTDEEHNLFAIPAPINYTILEKESEGQGKDEISSAPTSEVELASNFDANNSADLNSEFFISPITGEKFEIIKDPINETVEYWDQKGTIYADKEEILNYEIQRLSMSPNLLKLDEKLRDIVESDNKHDTVPVIIAFVEQPAHNVSIEVQATYEPIFKEITAPAKAVYERIEPLMTAADEDSNIIATEQDLLTEDEKDLLNETRARLDQETMRMRRDIFERSAPLADEIQAPVIRNLEARGSEIRYSGKIYNSIAARVPIGYLEELSQDPSIAAIWYDEVFNASLDVSASAMYANSWWSAGYTGGIWDAAVVDTGVDGSHPDLSVDLAKTFHASGSTDPAYNDDPDSTDDLHGHGTHCAGIVASTNSTYKGIGYGLGMLINAKAGWLTTTGGGSMRFSDRMEAIDWALDNPTDDADVISFSFGAFPGSTGDTASCHHMDAVVFDLNTPIAIAAGNNGPATTTVTDPGSAYNVITVGNVNDKNTVTRSDDSIYTSSSRGPTGDGRLKPDVTAPGTCIMSCNYNWESEDDFVNKTGTSMATPHIAGSILLILDYVASQWDSKAVKALLANTAGDLGTSGPDNTYGYGYVDLDHAYFHRGDVHTGSLAATPEGAVEKFYKGPAVSGDTATLVWNRHVIYNGAAIPTQYLSLSDLDLYMYDESDGLGISSSTSSLNNAEQVRSDSSYSSAIIKIEPIGSYPVGITAESYALATEESFSQVNPPTLSASLSVPDGTIPSGGTFTASTTVTNTGDIKAHGVSASLNLPSGFSIVSGSNPQNLGSIDQGAGNGKSATWMVQAPTTGSTQNYTISTSASSNSYGDTYTATNSAIVTIEPNRQPNTPSLPSGPTSGTSGVPYNYSTFAIDPDGDQIKYTFDWDDGTTYETGLVDSGTNVSASHSWSVPAGSATEYYIRAKATDSQGKTSDWSDPLPVTITGVNDTSTDFIGVFRPSIGVFYLDYENNGWTTGDAAIYFGTSGDLPIAGDWDNDGIDEIGVFRPSMGVFFLDYDNNGWTTGDAAIYFGTSGDLPIAGDWDNDGIDEIGVFRPSMGVFFLDYQNNGWTTGDAAIYFGTSGDLPVAGDWDNDRIDEIGVFRPSMGVFFLDYQNNGWTTGDAAIYFGISGDQPMAGSWS